MFNTRTVNISRVQAEASFSLVFPMKSRTNACNSLASLLHMYYHNWTRTTLTAFVPFLLLAVLNGRIIFQIRKAEKLTASRIVSALSDRVFGWVGVARPRKSQQLKEFACLYRVSHLLVDLGWDDFDLGVPPSCQAAQPPLPNYHESSPGRIRQTVENPTQPTSRWDTLYEVISGSSP